VGAGAGPSGHCDAAHGRRERCRGNVPDVSWMRRSVESRMKNLPSIILVPCLALLALLALPCVASPPPAQTMRVQSDAVYEKQSPEREKIQAWLGRQVGADTRGPPKGRVDALGAIRIRYDVAVEPGQAMDWAK